MSTIEILRTALERMPAVRLAAVFGSEVRAGAFPGRDIDLAVIVDETALDRQTLGVALERLVHRPTDVVLLNHAPPLLRSEIARHGRVIIERQPYAWADFRARAMIDWWDWAPTARLVQRTVAARLREELNDGAP